MLAVPTDRLRRVVAAGSGPRRVVPALTGRRRLEPRESRAQLSVLVAQLPVRLAQTFEPLGHPPDAGERPEGQEEGSAGEQPQKGQQNAYLIERLATVSTA